MRIAVIGATGNVGTALLTRLQRAARDREAIQRTGYDTSEDADGISITAIARTIPDATQEPYNGIDWHAIDIGTDEGRDALTRALEGADAVVHLAWAIQPNHDEPAMRRTNVTGTANVLHAAGTVGVRQVVCASSVAAYSPADKDGRRDETWPTDGVGTSQYSRQKADQERLLDAFEQDYPEIAVARLRPGLIFQDAAGSEVGRYFLGPLIPKVLLGRLPLPLLPIPSDFIFQAVHAEDVAEAYWRVVARRASGAFNIAAEPELTPARLADLLGARRVIGFPVRVLRWIVAASWGLGIQRTDPGWIDLAAQSPVMDTSRASRDLGWEPRHSSREAVAEVLAGMRRGAGLSGSPKMYPRSEG
ncbi:NAD-dependent epimerase/dehydratase family protein [Arthrobacter sp. NamB2]|uniref:NAD-dependent epimerase/dehydratase family protein n=1 Tax=Arthrobacter sp. NamB2 TaxID=2576035 RepID=UPI0010CA10C7|nr:NAD-dependent epimerase/dehydratase family protein [Arthrobacter sp. NamB2]TKV29262.1 NAD-dependent epimerase/dehydratase family protein [Arthrobacter sp. NamB2]